MSPRERRCRRARELLPFVDGELPTDEALAFEEHVEGCASCRAALDSQRALEEALVSLPRPKVLLPDRARLAEGIARRIAERAPAVAPASSLRRVAAACAAAAALLLVALYVIQSPRRGAAPSISAPDVDPTSDVATSPPSGEAIASPSGEFEVAAPGLPWSEARGELASIVRNLACEATGHGAGDLLSRFVAAVEPLRQRGVALPGLLLSLVRDPDPVLAGATAELLARAASGNELGREESSLVPTLEAQLRRPECGAAMVRALVAVGTPRAWEAVAHAAQIARLRPLALAAIAARGEPSQQPLLESELKADLRASSGEEAVARTLAAMRLRNAEQLHLLADLLRAGIPAAPIALPISAGGETTVALLGNGLAERSTRRDALLLAPLVPAARIDALALPLAELVRRGDEPAAALEALAQIGRASALGALVELAGDRSLPRSRARLAAAAFDAALARCGEIEDELARVRDAGANDETLVELCRAAPGAAGRAARSSLLLAAELPSAMRVGLALELAQRREALDAEAFDALVAESAARRAAGEGDEGLTAALLVLLQATEGEEGLERGLRALGVELTRTRQERLRDAARLVARGSDGRREVARVDALLKLAP